MATSVFPIPSAGVNQFTQRFLSSGTFTAPSTCYSVEVTLVGGGGGSGGIVTPPDNGQVNSAGGGGGGQVLKRTFSVTPGAAYTVTIGNGGAAGSSTGGTPGGVGGDSLFGSLATALGGGGGWGWNVNNPTVAISRATSGGQSSIGNNIVAGAGGGAGGDAQYKTNSELNQAFYVNSWTQTSSNNNTSSAGGLGSFAGGNTKTVHSGGIGIDGFGAGGAGGVTAFSAGFPSSSGMATFNGVAPVIRTGVFGAAANGVSPAANTGHGANGGGSVANGTAFPANGAAGGSGICIVTYFA